MHNTKIKTKLTPQVLRYIQKGIEKYHEKKEKSPNNHGDLELIIPCATQADLNSSLDQDFNSILYKLGYKKMENSTLSGNAFSNTTSFSELQKFYEPFNDLQETNGLIIYDYLTNDVKLDGKIEGPIPQTGTKRLSVCNQLFFEAIKSPPQLKIFRLNQHQAEALINHFNQNRHEIYLNCEKLPQQLREGSVPTRKMMPNQ